MIDTHAHLYAEQFKDDRDHAIERALAQGITQIILPNIDHSSIDGMLSLEEKYTDLCHATIGLHPCSVKKGFEKELYLVEEWLNRRSFKAIGEIGTDLYWDKTYLDEQVEAFKIQVQWAKEHELPIIIHCRESIDMTIDLVEELKDDRLSGVFHCFTGSVEQAERIKSLGFFIGLGGVVTFKNGGMHDVVPELDLEHVLLETDAPYLAPVPHRGKRNEPAYVTEIAQKVADLQHISVEDLDNITTANTIKLFDLDGGTE